MKNLRLLATFCIITTAFAEPTYASVVYKYVGNNFDSFEGIGYDESMSITGTIELATVLPPNTSSIIATIDVPNTTAEINPISFTFSDGVNTITDNLSALEFFVEADSTSNIILWAGGMQRFDTGLSMLTENFFLSTGILAQGDVSIIPLIGSGSVSFNPGTWSLVPIPPAVWLFGSGLLVLAGVARRK